MGKYPIRRGFFPMPLEEEPASFSSLSAALRVHAARDPAPTKPADVSPINLRKSRLDCSGWLMDLSLVLSRGQVGDLQSFKGLQNVITRFKKRAIVAIAWTRKVHGVDLGDFPGMRRENG